MAIIFLSYDHEDAGRAAPVAAALEKARHSVWWDRHIRGGAEYNSEIEGAVERADVVIVLWSKRSVRSAWVRDEAAEGRDRGKLVPVALDDTKPPMGFRQYQTISLPEWSGQKPPGGMAELLHAIKAVAGSAPELKAPAAINAPLSRAHGLRVGWAGAAAAVFVLSVVGLLLWHWFPTRTSAAVVSVAASDTSRGSQDRARDLLTKLGQLQSAKPDTLQLVDANARKRADLILEVAGATDAQQARANLVLLDGRTGGLLWSKGFERPVTKSGDLREEVGYTAAQVLGCALETHGGGRTIMKAETLKLYLKGCAQLADRDEQTAAALVPLFKQIIAAAPKFEGAWRNLLIADDEVYGNAPNPRAREQLKRDIASARKVNPNLGAAYAAEMSLLPDGAWGDKLAIADHGVATNPDDTWLLSLRSFALSAVGRMRDAIDDLRLAVRIDPLSPRLRADYIYALAAGGRSDAALSELQEAERLWPDSSSVARVKFVFHLRYGDPRIALQFIRSGTLNAAWAQAESFVQARINPTQVNIDRALKDVQAVYEREPYILQAWVQSLSIFDREDALLGLLMRVPIDQARYVTDVTFRPAAREFWRNPKSLDYAKRVGLLGYWQSSGKWPDFCGETDLPYDCKKEAAKLS